MFVSPLAHLFQKTLPCPCGAARSLPGSAGQRPAADGAHVYDANAESGEPRLPRASKLKSLQAAGCGTSKASCRRRPARDRLTVLKAVLDRVRDSSWCRDDRKVQCNLLPPRTSPTYLRSVQQS